MDVYIYIYVPGKVKWFHFSWFFMDVLIDIFYYMHFISYRVHDILYFIPVPVYYIIILILHKISSPRSFWECDKTIKISLLQKGLNVLQRISGEKINKIFLYRIHLTTLFIYFLHHKSDFVMAILAQVSDVAYRPLVYSKIFFN